MVSKRESVVLSIPGTDLLRVFRWAHHPGQHYMLLVVRHSPGMGHRPFHRRGLGFIRGVRLCKSWALAVVGREAVSFFGCRAFSGALDVFFMWLFVDILHCNDLLIKILSNIVVIVLNYVFSKLFIFKHKKES